jgi:uncharacterized iron-regulated membrane protein
MPGMGGMHSVENTPGMEHAQHAVFGRHTTMLAGPDAFLAVDKLVTTVAQLGLPNPVLISPPMHAGGNWTARSDTRDRPLRVDLVLNGTTGAVIKRTDFHSKPWLDRAIGFGIAAHEGQLFGVLNQMVSLFTTVCLVILSVSGVVMWRRRKPEGTLGAPQPVRRVRFSAGLIATLIAFGLYFPFLGGSMILVYLAERFCLRRVPATCAWLGLRPVGT